MYTDELTDETLWQGIRQNDEKAFAQLYDRYWQTIFTTSFYHLNDREACAEVVHDIFLNLWLKRSELAIGSFGPYLKTAARYHIYKKIKALNKQPVSYTDALDAFDGQLAYESGDEKLRYKDLQRRVETYLQDLPQRCREIFLLSRKDHLTNDEIAQRLGISKRTVENQITTALQHLRTSLKDLSVIILIIGWL